MASQWGCSDASGAPGWIFEGEVFAMALPVLTGACRIGPAPLYVVHNDRDGTPNYRYTTSPTTRSKMLANARTSAGFGPMGVAGCVPQP